MVRRSGSYVQHGFPGAGTGTGHALSIEAVYSQPGEAVVGESGVLRPERSEVRPLTRRELDQRGHEDADALLKRAGLDPRSKEKFYRLEHDTTFIVEFAESPPVPKGGVGLVRPSESLRSAGVIMNANFVRPNQSDIEATLHVVDQFSLVTAGAAVAELVVVPTAKNS